MHTYELTDGCQREVQKRKKGREMRTGRRWRGWRDHQSGDMHGNNQRGARLAQETSWARGAASLVTCVVTAANGSRKAPDVAPPGE